jgi:large subunit ribosomal protein L13
MDNKTYTIDATDKVLGRLAVKVAVLLQGKNKIDFARNKNTGDLIIIKNINNIKVTGNKRQNKIYYHHSGYLGGMKEITFEKLFEKDPEKVFKKAVFGMLPNNKLRAKRIKRLKVE